MGEPVALVGVVVLGEPGEEGRLADAGRVFDGALVADDGIADRGAQRHHMIELVIVGEQEGDGGALVVNLRVVIHVAPGVEGEGFLNFGGDDTGADRERDGVAAVPRRRKKLTSPENFLAVYSRRRFDIFGCKPTS